MDEKNKIEPVSPEVRAAIKRKSAYNLPDRPSERGMKPDEIKRTLWSPMLDESNSLMAELIRIVTEANICFTNLWALVNSFHEKIENGDFDGEDGVSPTLSVTNITGGYKITLKDLSGEKSVNVLHGRNGTSCTAGDVIAALDIYEGEVTEGISAYDGEYTVS